MGHADDVIRILRAADFAAVKHRDQRRKNGDIPYVNHPIEVARILVEEGGVQDPVVLVAALLHDTVEDTSTTIEEIEAEFGPEVAVVVGEVTDDKSLAKAARKRLQVVHAAEISTGARLVKMADKLSNLRDLAVRPPPSWDADRVRGYFAWAHRVVSAMGDVNAELAERLGEVFASSVTVRGETFRAVTEDEGERASLLDAYYRRMEGTND